MLTFSRNRKGIKKATWPKGTRKRWLTSREWKANKIKLQRDRPRQPGIQDLESFYKSEEIYRRKVGRKSSAGECSALGQSGIQQGDIQTQGHLVWEKPGVQEAHNRPVSSYSQIKTKVPLRLVGFLRAESTKDVLVTGAWQRWEGVASGTEERLPVC